MLQRPSDRPVTPPGFGQTSFGQPSLVQDPSAAQPANTPLPPITLLPQQGQGPGQGQGALPPITLQPGSVNQPGGLPPITLAPVGAAGGQQMPGQIPGQVARPGSQQSAGRGGHRSLGNPSPEDCQAGSLVCRPDSSLIRTGNWCQPLLPLPDKAASQEQPKESRGRPKDSRARRKEFRGSRLPRNLPLQRVPFRARPAPR